MLRLCHGKLQKVVPPWFTTLNWGEGVTKFVLRMCINFAILAGLVSRVMSQTVKDACKWFINTKSQRPTRCVEGMSRWTHMFFGSSFRQISGG